MSKRAFGGIQSAPRLALPASPHRLSREERLVDNGTRTPPSRCRPDKLAATAPLTFEAVKSRGVRGFLLAAAALLAACSPGPDVTAEPTPTAVVSPPAPGEAVVLEAAECPGDAVIAQNPPGAHLPAGFTLSHWVHCAPDGRGHVARRSTQGPADQLVEALALPDVPAETDASCNAQYVTLPYLLAVNESGQAVHAWIPLELTCLHPRTEVVTAIDTLDWK